MSYLHCDHEEKHLTLHDCRATRVSLEDGELVFHFPNGFCICAKRIIQAWRWACFRKMQRPVCFCRLQPSSVAGG